MNTLTTDIIDAIFKAVPRNRHIGLAVTRKLIASGCREISFDDWYHSGERLASLCGVPIGMRLWFQQWDYGPGWEAALTAIALAMWREPRTNACLHTA